MASTIEWSKLRPWNGSLEGAFEELCCQLASSEPPTNARQFVRKSTPDAGLEGYWKLNDESEHGLQAKFFLSTPGDTQWRQIDDSVKTALSKHPRLTRYTVCLPIDRSDPKIPNQKWFMDKWDEHVKKWVGWAKKKRMKVDFDYWGMHEIFGRLSQNTHAGRRMFWFNSLELTQDWLNKNLKIALNSAGERYLPHFKDDPSLNVQLPFSEIFDGLGRTPAFWQNINRKLAEIERHYAAALENPICAATDIILKEDIEPILKLDERAKNLFSESKDGYSFNSSIQDFSNIETALAGASYEITSKLKVIWRWSRWKINVRSLLDLSKTLNPPFGKVLVPGLEELIDEAKYGAFECPSRIKSKSETKHSHDSQAEAAKGRFHVLARAIGDLSGILSSHSCQLAETPALLLIGEALIGKTHLFCDIANERIKNNLPTIIILGQTLRDNENPWLQILKELGLNCTRDEFLGVLNAWGEALGSRIIIMIDALNEGLGKVIWPSHLSGFIQSISAYPALSLAMSVRDTELAATVDLDSIKKITARIQHPGFENVEHLALKAYCTAFRIDLPSMPTVHPIFHNPGFLYLTCSALQNEGKRTFPKGSVGLSWVFDTFISSVHKKLWQPSNLDYDRNDNKVAKAIDALADAMVAAGQDWIELNSARQIVDAFLPGRTQNSKTLFNAMMVEGIISVDNYSISDVRTPVCRFSFQRFEQYVVVGKYLDKSANCDPQSGFSKTSPIGLLFENEHKCWMNSGLLEAFSVLIPERLGVEVSDALPWIKTFRAVKENFVRSLIWRAPSSYSQKTFDYLNQHAIETYEDEFEVFDALLMLSCIPQHPLNADFLGKNLKKRKMVNRDRSWSIYLHKRYDSGAPIDRIIEWAATEGHKNHVDVESRRLCGVILTWFLSTPNRFVRDRSTKALVNLLADNLDLVEKLIDSFGDIDDLYILERLLAAAFGCTLRESSKDAIRSLAQKVFDCVYSRSEVIPHVLVREYAKSIIDFALYLKIDLGRDLAKIKSPFRTSWPASIPKKEDFDFLKNLEPGSQSEQYKWAGSHLYESVLGWEDFSRYVIGEHNGSQWSSQRLNKPYQLNKKQKFDQFVKSLKTEQKRAWEKFEESISKYRSAYLASIHSKKAFTKAQKVRLELHITKMEAAFVKTLPKIMQKTYKAEYQKFAYGNGSREKVSRVDLNTIKCLVMKRVLDYGWDIETFGEFDYSVNRYSNDYRAARKAERVGKKYQWLAYHEIVSRLADNFYFFDERYSDNPGIFHSAWQITGLRDIDPTSIDTGKPDSEDSFRSDKYFSWWAPLTYDGVDGESSKDFRWLRVAKDFPDVRQMIEVKSPTDNSEWLVLHSSRSWMRKEPDSENPQTDYKRQLRIHLDSFLVKEQDFAKAFNWAKQTDFWETWKPESNDIHESYVGELYWASVFNSPAEDYYPYDGWIKKSARDSGIKRPACDVLPTTRHMSISASDYDCSVKERGGASVNVPCKWLFEKMKLMWKGKVGQYYNQAGVLVCIDPSFSQKGAGALLVKKKEFLEFLKKNKLKIIWSVQAEKNLIINRRHDYGPDVPGSLEFSGAFAFSKQTLTGKVTARARSKGRGIGTKKIIR